jgi:two-component system, cell cycle response regulator DivK
MVMSQKIDLLSLARILLVEDNDASRQLMSDFLEYNGYHVYSLPGGRDFNAALSSFRPHVILLDLKLPDVDGFTLLQQYQRQPDRLKVPIIVVSAYSFQADQQRALMLGARQYLVKPVSLSQLTQAIHQELAYLSA